MEDLIYKKGYYRLLEEVLALHSTLGRLNYWNDEKQGITPEKLSEILTELETRLKDLKNENINQ